MLSRSKSSASSSKSSIFSQPNGLRRNLHSKTLWFTRFCNSHQVSYFATLFIDARAEISVVESRFGFWWKKVTHPERAQCPGRRECALSSSNESLQKTHAYKVSSLYEIEYFPNSESLLFYKLPFLNPYHVHRNLVSFFAHSIKTLIHPLKKKRICTVYHIQRLSATNDLRRIICSNLNPWLPLLLLEQRRVYPHPLLWNNVCPNILYPNLLVNTGFLTINIHVSVQSKPPLMLEWLWSACFQIFVFLLMTHSSLIFQSSKFRL